MAKRTTMVVLGRSPTWRSAAAITISTEAKKTKGGWLLPDCRRVNRTGYRRQA